MKFFADTSDLDAIKDLADLGMLDGVTTNPSIIAKSGKEFLPLIKEICGICEGPVSAEVASTDFDTMMKEGKKLASLADNIAVKVPLTEAGLKVCKNLTDAGKMVNVTLCFSPLQAVLAAKAGATFISPFVGRLDDIGNEGMDLIHEIAAIYDNYPDFHTEILVASIRHPQHILQSAKLGADVITAPPEAIKKMYNHPLTDKGLAAFVEDWKKTGQSIL
ncbi:MAG: fructose-6-phosphate aldolase [Alphaproteobacteria bacterium]|nr:fructose-6-phosphate aldolase [Alphaproteobacteria bacterium]